MTTCDGWCTSCRTLYKRPQQITSVNFLDSRLFVRAQAKSGHPEREVSFVGARQEDPIGACGVER